MMIGIIAGGGHLPLMLKTQLAKEGKPFFVVALEGFCDLSLYQDCPHKSIRVGAIGEILKTLKQNNATTLVFAGSVQRPSLSSLRPDATALKWLTRLGVKAFGDDGLFRGIIGELAKEGFQVLGVQDFLPQTLVGKGTLGGISPNFQDHRDIEKGILVAHALGVHDVGQAVVVEQGLVLAVEGIEGTAAMMHRTQGLKREAKGGVLVKAFKPQQESRVDLPAIGPETVKQAMLLGLNGIALESGRALIISPEETFGLADKNGLFIFGF